MKRIIIDCSKMTSRIEAHRYLKELFDFPDYYGNNLDALADCLSELSTKTSIKMINTDKLIENLGNYHKGFIRVFSDIAESNNNIKFKTDL